jgi:hypothetical protein
MFRKTAQIYVINIHRAELSSIEYILIIYAKRFNRLRRIQFFINAYL